MCTWVLFCLSTGLAPHDNYLDCKPPSATCDRRGTCQRRGRRSKKGLREPVPSLNMMFPIEIKYRRLFTGCFDPKTTRFCNKYGCPGIRLAKLTYCMYPMQSDIFITIPILLRSLW